MIKFISRCFGLSLIFLLSLPCLSDAKDPPKLQSLRLGQHENYIRIAIDFSDTPDHKETYQKEQNRYEIFFSETEEKNHLEKKLPPPLGVIRDIRLNKKAKGLSLVISFRAPVDPKVQKVISSKTKKTFIVDFFYEKSAPLASSEPLAPRPSSKVSKSEKKALVKPKPLIILDPGHGGMDAGATYNGIREKDLVLKIGLYLQDILLKTGRYRVMMTRTTDTFLSLKQRRDMAHNNHADVFISIHANAAPFATHVSGLSVFSLSETASDGEAEKLAQQENSVDEVAGVDLSENDPVLASIFFDLSQKEFMYRAAVLSDIIIKQSKPHGVNVLKSPQRSAGFAVLKAPDVTAVLVETGFLTNKEEARHLKVESYQKTIAASIKASIDVYFKRFGSG